MTGVVRAGGGGRLRSLLLVWSLPLAIVGWLVELALWALGWRLQGFSVPGQPQARAVWVRGPLATYMVRRWTGMTIGWLVLYWVEPNERLVKHEARHVQQAVWFGPLVVPLYLLGLLFFGYRNNPFEMDARAAADA